MCPKMLLNSSYRKKKKISATRLFLFFSTLLISAARWNTFPTPSAFLILSQVKPSDHFSYAETWEVVNLRLVQGLKRLSRDQADSILPVLLCFLNASLCIPIQGHESLFFPLFFLLPWQSFGVISNSDLRPDEWRSPEVSNLDEQDRSVSPL